MAVWVILAFLIPFVTSVLTEHDFSPPQVEITHDKSSKFYKIVIKTPYFEKQETVGEDGTVFGDCKFKSNRELKDISYVISKESFFFLGDYGPNIFEDKNKEDGNLEKTSAEEKRYNEENQFVIGNGHFGQSSTEAHFSPIDLPNLNSPQFQPFQNKKTQENNINTPGYFKFELPYPLQSHPIGFVPVIAYKQIPTQFYVSNAQSQPQISNNYNQLFTKYFQALEYPINCFGVNCKTQAPPEIYEATISTERFKTQMNGDVVESSSNKNEPDDFLDTADENNVGQSNTVENAYVSNDDLTIDHNDTSTNLTVDQNRGDTDETIPLKILEVRSRSKRNVSDVLEIEVNDIEEKTNDEYLFGNGTTIISEDIQNYDEEILNTTDTTSFTIEELFTTSVQNTSKEDFTTRKIDNSKQDVLVISVPDLESIDIGLIPHPAGVPKNNL